MMKAIKKTSLQKPKITQRWLSQRRNFSLSRKLESEKVKLHFFNVFWGYIFFDK